MAKKQSPPEEEEYKIVSLKMFPTMIEDIDGVRKSQGGISRSAWIRQAIIEKLKREKKES